MAKSRDKLTLYAQGMRRSGTTILYDILVEDGSFDCFYEPLAWGKPAFGGGSGVHSDMDLFENIRKARKEFLAGNPVWLQHCPQFSEMNLFNYGAPRLADLEFEPDLPRYCTDYLRFLSNKSDRTFLKFTRMHSKIHCLREIMPHSRLLHIVRDPRHVASSYLFGKNARNKDRFRDAEHFFARKSDATSWSSKAFSDYILKIPGYDSAGECEDFLRILLIWKYKFERTHAAGTKCFGDDYMLFSHDDFLERPLESIRKLEQFLDTELSSGAVNWAVENLKKPSRPYAHDDPHWQQAFRRLKMESALTDAGFEHLL